MDIRILVSDHSDSRELALIEVMILSPLGLWKKVETWGIFRDVLSDKLVELEEFYAEENNVSVDCETCSHNYEAQDFTNSIEDSSPVTNKQGELIPVDFEALATARAVSCADAVNDTIKPSLSSTGSLDVDPFSMSCQPWRRDVKRDRVFCRVHTGNWRSSQEWSEVPLIPCGGRSASA